MSGNLLFSNYSSYNNQNKYFRFDYIFNFTTFFGAIAHGSFIFLFLFIDVKEMAIFNIFSFLTWLIIYLFLKDNYPRIAYISGYTEVTLHAVLATYYIGWDSGFHYYIFSTVIVLFYMSYFKNKMKITLSIFAVSLYIVLFYSFTDFNPVYNINETVLNFLFCSNIIIAFFIFGFLTYFYNRAANKAERKLERANKKLTSMATTDHLTGLLNRRSMINYLEMAIDKYNKTGANFTIIMIDIDDFKNINDKYGHDCGDKVLTSVANIMNKNIRKNDLIARWGGEEFLILLKNTTHNEAEIVAKKLKKSINKKSIPCINNKLDLTMTFGVKQFEKDLDSCINKADKALYQGKNRGKNCVIVYNSI